MRRESLGIALAVLVVLAGCGSGGGSRTPEPIEGTASQATVAGSVLSETGFGETTVERVQVRRNGTLQISGDVQMDLNYRVTATGWRATYRHSGGGSDPPTVVALYTVPLVSPDRVAATIDPLGDRSPSAVVGEAQGTYGEPAGLERVRNRSLAVLGTDATVVQYAGTATVDGERIDVSVYVTVVEHDSDVVRAVAVAPGGVDSWTSVRALFEGIRH